MAKKNKGGNPYKKNPKGYFWRIYGVYIVILAIVIVGVSIYTWRGVAEYQKHQPDVLMAKVIDDIQEYGENPLTYKQDLSADVPEGSLLYRIFDGDEELATAQIDPSIYKGIVGLTLYRRGLVKGSKDVLIKTLSTSSVLINGTPAQMELVTEEGIVPEGAEEFIENEDYDFGIDTYVKLSLPGCFEYPEITASLGGDPCLVTDDGEGNYLCTPVINDSTSKAMTKEFEDFAKKYLNYLNNDSSWSSFSKSVLSKSDAYANLKKAPQAISHEDMEITKLEVSELEYYSPHLYSARVQCETKLHGFSTHYEHSRSFDNIDYTFYLSDVEDNTWKLFKFEIN